MLNFTSLQVRAFLPSIRFSSIPGSLIPASSFIGTWILALVILPALLLISKDIKASNLSTEIQTLVIQGNSLNTQLTALTLTADTSCSELASVITAVKDYTNSIDTVSVGLTAPLTLDVDSLLALDNLTVLSAGIAGNLPGLSTQVSALSLSVDLVDIQSSFDAILKLSDDIGTMADRILEMADKILVMADNIGLMADRILLTQQIQTSNMALTQSFLLATQQNIIVLMPTIDTSAYNLPLNDLLSTGSYLSLDMNNTQLTESNMNSVLADYETRVKNYLNTTQLMSAVLNSDSRFASFNINADTLTILGDLSVLNAALADSLKRFSDAINTLAPGTSIAILDESVYSMLRLAADIGLMGNRIVEMGDNIGVMADNMGLMTLRLVETQTLQQSNISLTQANLSSAQISTVTVISAFGL